MLSATRFDYKKFDGLLANLSSRMTNSRNVSAHTNPQDWYVSTQKVK
jgi:hypothetical protein